MKRLFCFIQIIIFFSITLLSCTVDRNWIQFRGDQGRGATATTINPPLALRWNLHLQADVEIASAFNPPIIIDNTIYFGSYDGNFYALDIESGYMNWVFNSGNHINSIPSGDEQNVYFGSNDGKVYALSQDEGDLIWSFDTGEFVSSSVTVYKDQIVFITDSGSCYFLDKQGNLLHKLPNPVWAKFAFQIYDDVLYFAPGPEYNLYSLSVYDIKQREYLWVVDDSLFDAHWYSVAAIDKERLYFATAEYDYDGYLIFKYYALERHTGAIIWKYEDISDLGDIDAVNAYILIEKYSDLLDYMAPSLWQNLVIYTSGDKKVRAFDTENGSLVWVQSFDHYTSSAPTVAGNRVYFGIEGDAIYPEEDPPQLVCISAQNGRPLWNVEIEGAVLSAPVIAGKWIVFGTDKHCFYVLEEVF